MTKFAGHNPIMSADTLRKDEVRNAAGEDLGKIEDFMIDLNDGKVRYAVLSFGGVLGLGNKLFAVPPEALSVDTENECLVLNVDKDRLKDAPGFDKDNWPDFADSRFGQEIYQYYGHNPYWETAA